MKQVNLPPARKLFSDAFIFYKTHIAIIAAIGLVPAVLSFIGVIAVTFSIWIALLFNILSFVAGIFALLAFYDVVRSNGSPEGGAKSAYARAKSMILPYAWVLFLGNLAVAGGLFLLVIPGIIFSILLGQSVYAYVLEDKRGTDALVVSWHYVRGNWWGVFWRMLFMGIIFLVISAILFLVIGFGLTGGDVINKLQEWGGVGTPANQQALAQAINTAGRFMQVLSDALINIFFVPFSVIYLSLLYRALQGAKSDVMPSEEEQAKMRKTIKVFIATAIIGLILLVIAFGFFFWPIDIFSFPAQAGFEMKKF